MSPLDILILIAVIATLLAIGLIGKANTRSTEGYFLAGRNLPWYKIGFSLFTANFSASAIIGLTGAAYATGIAIYNYEWLGILALIFFALVLVSVIRGRGVYTIAQYLGERYDDRVKIFFSVFTLILMVLIDMAVSLYAGGLLIHEIIPQLPLTTVIILVMVLATIYSLAGGLEAIARTDVFQSIIILIGAIFISVYCYKAVGGWGAFIEGTPSYDMSLIRPLNDRAVPWLGLVIGIPILCAYFWLTNQNMVQWVLSARSQTDARRGLLLAGLLKIVILFVIIMPGVAAVIILPDIAEPDRIYPSLLLALLPVGVLGLVLAGFFSALMSNADSTVHAASTIVTMDLVKPKFPALSSRQLVWVGRLTTIIIISISAVWAPFIGNFGSLFEYVQGVLSYTVAPVVVVYLAGLFWPRATSKGAIAALFVGTLAAVIIGLFSVDGIFSNILNYPDYHYLYVPLPVSLLSLATLILVSLRDERPVVDSELLWSPIPFNAEYKKDIVLAVGLLLAVLAIVCAFR